MDLTGQRYVRTILDAFKTSGPDSEHHCLVHKPMWDSLNELLARNVHRRFTEELLREALRRLFAALDYLHTECHVIHTGTAMLFLHAWICTTQRRLLSRGRCRYQRAQHSARH